MSAKFPCHSGFRNGLLRETKRGGTANNTWVVAQALMQQQLEQQRAEAAAVALKEKQGQEARQHQLQQLQLLQKMQQQKLEARLNHAK